jgi:ABC-2 type transport system permease protein
MLTSHRFIGFQTLVRKEILRFVRIWPQTLLPPAITMTLYFIIFGNLVGSQLSSIQGYSYMQYLAPGLIMMSIVTNAYSNVVFSLYSARFQKHIEEILISPMPNWLILCAYMVGGMVRGLGVGLVVGIISLFFTHLQLIHPWLTLMVVLLTAILFALAGFLNGIYARSFDDTSIVPTFILTPLTYFGGVFYSIQSLSPFWHQLSLYNPILYMVNAFRYGIIGISDVNLGLALFIIVVTIIALFIINLRLLNKGVGIRS